MNTPPLDFRNALVRLAGRRRSSAAAITWRPTPAWWCPPATARGACASPATTCTSASAPTAPSIPCARLPSSPRSGRRHHRPAGSRQAPRIPRWPPQPRRPRALETDLRLVPIAARPKSHGWHGNALFVRRGSPLLRAERIDLPHAEPRGAVLAEIRLTGGNLRVVSAHPRPAAADPAAAARTSDGLHRPARADADAADGRSQRVAADARPFAVRLPAAAVRPTDVHVASFPTSRPLFPLDRIFATPPGLIVDFAVHDTPLARRASDHLPRCCSTYRVSINLSNNVN